MTEDEEERAAIREYEGGYRRRVAELLAIREHHDPQEAHRLRRLQIILGISAAEEEPYRATPRPAPPR